MDELCTYIKANHAGGKFIYASGETITQELSEQNCGAAIERIIVYKTIPLEKFSNEFVQKLNAAEFNSIIFFSSQSAKIFCELLQKEQLGSFMHNLNAFCFSNKIATSIKSYGFKATVAPQNSNFDGFMKLLLNFQF